MTEANTMPLLGGYFTHYTDNKKMYTVLNLGRLEKDGVEGEVQVVYRALGDTRIWIRPYSEFVGSVSYNGQIVQRFLQVDFKD